MKKYLIRLTSALTLAAMLLSVSAFAADITMTFVIKEGSAKNGAAANNSINSEVKTDGSLTWNEVVKEKGDTVYAQVYLRPSAATGGSGTPHIYYDTDFFELASGSSDYKPQTTDYQLNNSLARMTVLGGGIANMYNPDGYHGSFIKVKTTILSTKTLAGGEDNWVATLCFKVRQDTDKADGWIRTFVPVTNTDATGTDYHWGTSWQNSYNEDPAYYEDLHVVLGTVETYDVTWKNGDTTLETDTGVSKGSQPSYDGAAPTPPTGKTFVGWSTNPDATAGTLEEELPAVQGDTTYYAIFTDQTCTVTWKSQDGNTQLELDANHPVGTKPSFDGTEPARAGYVFAGWANTPNATSGTAAANLPVVTEDTVYYAAFTNVTYTVTWMNGETQLEKDENVAAGARPDYNGLSDPSQDGYTFVGWSANRNDTAGVADTELPLVTGNATYYAIFTNTKYTVKWMNGGTTLETDANVTAGTKPSFDQTDPATTGKTFVGWSTNPDATTGTPENELPRVTSNVTYYAIFADETYTVTWMSQDGGTQLEQDKNVAKNSKPQFNSTTPAKADDATYVYTFDGWATNRNQETGTVAGSLPAVTDNVTYYAAFKKTPKNLNITHTAGTGGAITNPGARTIPTGSNDTYTVTAADGYVIDKITQDGTELPGVSGTKTFDGVWTPTKDATVRVTFKPATYNVSTTASAGGSLSANPNNDVAAGATVTLTATPETNYTLDTLAVVTTGGTAVPTTKVNDATYTFTMPASDVVAAATFKSNTTPVADTYTVTTRAEGGGTLTANKTAGLNAGETVTFTATPANGKKLASLTVTDAAGNVIAVTNNKTITMPASNVTAVAVFTAIGNGGGTGGGTSPSSPSIKPVTPPATTGVAGMLNTTDHIRYLRGYPEGDIRPGGNITRAETAQIFYRLLLYPDVTVNKSFTDVLDGQWYAKAVRALASLGIVNGYEDGTFHPNAPITRAEFTAIATRFAKVTNGTVSFADVSASHWAYGNIATAAGYGWINGYEDGTFRPANTITRAETATIVNHMLGRAADSEWLASHRSEINQFTDLQNPSIWYYLDMVEASNSHDYSMTTAEKWSRVIKDEIE